MKKYQTAKRTGAYVSDKVIDANFGDILYMREDGKIKAVKYVAVELRDRCPRDTYRHLDVLGCYIVAGESEEQKKQAYDIKLYRTVQDCRQGTNEVPNFTADVYAMAEEAGFPVTGASNDIPVCKFYQWDGYYPREVKVLLTDFVIRYSGESFDFKQVKEKKLYRSFEECENDNFLEVITFPETL